MDLGVVDNLTEQPQAERRQRAFPQFSGRLALSDEAPILGSDRAGVHTSGKMIDAASGDWITFLDGPFDRGEAAMAGQQRRVIADAAEFCRSERLFADARVAV